MVVYFHDELGRMLIGDSSFDFSEVKPKIGNSTVTQAWLESNYRQWFFAGYRQRNLSEPIPDIWCWLRQSRFGKSAINTDNRTVLHRATRIITVYDAFYFEDARDAVEFRLMFDTVEDINVSL